MGHVEQREEIENVRVLLENNKFSLHTMSVKIDQMNDTKKIWIEEQERSQGQVKSWEKKLRNMEVKVKCKGHPITGHKGPVGE